MKREKAFAIILNLLFISSVLYWPRVYGIDSGFYFIRLSQLTIDFSNIIPPGYHDLPLYPYFISPLSVVTNTTLLEITYSPILQTLGIISLVLFSKSIINKRTLIISSVFVTYLYVFAPSHHLREYELAKILFLFLISICILYIKYNDKRYIFIIIPILISLRFMGVPMAMWSLVFILSFYILSTIFSDYILENARKASISMLFIFIVIFIFSNPKVTSLIATRSISLISLVDSFEILIIGILTASEVSLSEYRVQPSSPRWIRVSYTISFISILGTILLYLLKRAWILVRRQNLTMQTLLILSLLSPLAADFIVYASIGESLQIRYFVLVFPTISLCILDRTSPGTSMEKYIHIILLTIIIGGIFVGYIGSYDKDRELKNDIEQLDRSSDYIHISENSPNVTTGYGTYAMLNYIKKDNQRLQFIRFNDGSYKWIVEGGTSNPEMDYILINERQLDSPIFAGPPDWTHYQPISENYDRINNNAQVEKTYTSGSYTILNNSGY